jgi:hypothetical protein
MFVRRIGLSFALAATMPLFGCTPASDDLSSQSENAVASTNGLAMINGLSMANGLAMANGLSMANGLAMANGLSMANGLMTTDAGRNTVAYLVRCALAAGDTLTKQDASGTTYTFEGAIGLAPEWKNGACGPVCQEWISACMLAHVNTAGVHIPIYLVAQSSAVGWGQSPDYPNQEGSFFGNIFYTNNVGKVDAYYCNGPGFNQDVVPGRIGANQVNAPYRDLFGSGGYCNVNGCVPSDAKTNGVSDGYKQCVMGEGPTTAWNSVVTVWRQNKEYNAAGTVVPGVTADGRTIRYDFEGSTNGWTSGNTQVKVSSTSEAGAQSGTSALKVSYTSGASTLTIQGPTGLSLAAGTQVSFYIYLAADSALTSINPFIKKAGGGNNATSATPVKNLLKGSWNVVNITVPASFTGSQVGVQFQTSGAFSAYIDSITW